MTRKTSPIIEAGLTETTTSFDSPRERLLIYVIRAADFYTHPFFASNGVVADVIARDLVFESLAFRLRPIAMTVSDDCSIWATLQTLRELGAVEESVIEGYEARYRAWLALTDEELRAHWPAWEVEEPKTAQRFVELMGYGTPIQELWDRVFGDGPHSDYRRVIRNKAQDWTPEGRESKQARYGKLLATIKAIHPLIVDLQTTVQAVIEGPGDPNAKPFTIMR